MDIGKRVRVKARAGGGSDNTYAGRTGRVVAFDASLPWTGPRALLAPEQFVCVHLEPKTKLEQKRGSPMVLLSEQSLALTGDSRVESSRGDY